MNLDEQIIPELPYIWLQALTQGFTGIIATPTEEQIENIRYLSTYLVPIIGLIGHCSINSWLRTSQHNHDIGGAPHSAHLLGAAVDLHPQKNSVGECKEMIKATSNRKLFFEINTTNWLHLDFKHDHDFIA